VGVPAARGHGVMEVQTFEVPCGSPEHTASLPLACAPVDRPLGSIGPGTKVLLSPFA
jgi:hypothetical protein